MQLNSQIAPIGHAVHYYQASKEVELDSSLTEFDEDILEVISVHQPIMARYIASHLTLRHKFLYKIGDINSRLTKTLSNYLTRDKYFRWSLRHAG